MSLKAIIWAWALPIPPGDKLVLMALADHSDDDGLCWPGTKGVAVKCKLEQRTVVRHIANLEQVGYLTRLARYREDGSQTSNSYRLCMERSEASPLTPATSGDDASDTGGMTPATSHESPIRIPQRIITSQRIEADEDFRKLMRQKYQGILTDIDERIEEALAHVAASKYNDKQKYVRGWLRREAEGKNGGSNGRATVGEFGSNPATNQRRPLKVYIPPLDEHGNPVLGH